MIIKSNFGLRSARDAMCGLSVCFVKWNSGCRTEAWPASHGSMRMLKAPAKWSGWWSDVVEAGEKANRNVQSELSCCTDRDMMIVVYVRVRAISLGYHLVLPMWSW